MLVLHNYNLQNYLTQTAAGPWRRETSHEVDALDSKQTVEVVIIRDADFITVGVLQVSGTLAALLGVVTVYRVCWEEKTIKHKTVCGLMAGRISFSQEHLT